MERGIGGETAPAAARAVARDADPRDKAGMIRAAAIALLAAALPLAACAPGGPVEGASAAPAEALAQARWPAAPPVRAVMLVVHGYGDYAETLLGEVAPFWAASGIEVRAYDQRGFGRNASRGAWPGAEALISDFAAQARAARADHPDLPLIALGHSLGGGVVLAALGEGRAPEVDGAVLLAPAIGGGPHINGFMRAGMWAMTTLIPDRRLSGEGIVRIQASDNVPALRALAADPLYLAKPTPREMQGLVRIMDRAEAAAGAVEVPLLIALGARDEVVDNADVRAVAAKLPRPPDLRDYSEGWHLLLRDLGRRAVWEDVRDWVLARAP
ncbi:alpha/beta fold hydrolase [Rubrimonas sp.]|uniref:alpha/beta fold hydrolase n=1 Tax=Rubrimonas sp. TaxID=2036015 RepID=UPI002FDDD9B6